MQPAVLIARLVGPVFVALGLGILLNASFYAAAITEAVHSPTLIYLSGVAALLAGLAVLNAHSAWPADWRVIVTIFGWLCVVGGVMRIVLPQLTASLATALYSGPTRLAIVGAVVLILGGYLSFEGYRLSPAQRRSLRA
jgi:uncharacterized membrane protein